MSLLDGDSPSQSVSQSPAELSICNSQDSDREIHSSGHDVNEGECATVTPSVSQPTNNIGTLIHQTLREPLKSFS